MNRQPCRVTHAFNPLGCNGQWHIWKACAGLVAEDGQTTELSTCHEIWTGALMGLIETVFGTAGPIVMAWLSRQQDDIEYIRVPYPW